MLDSSPCSFDAQYERVKLLGEGAYGSAYLVRQREKGKKHVLHVAKEIRTAHLSEKQKEGVLAEAQVLKMMKHSNIIAYHDSFFDGPKMYIIMEYADGGDLAAKIKDRKTDNHRFEEKEIMFIFVQVALALLHIHSRRVLHRDLKPLNIFLTKQGVVKLGDFGIARLMDSSIAEAQTTIGTPFYLSPEMCNSEGYGLKSDLWSLGVVTYELTVLKVPFAGTSLPAVAMQIMGAEPSPLPEEYSADLKWIIFRFLEKDPEKRPRLDHVLRMPFVQGYIQILLSHTLENRAGGCEAIASESIGPGAAPQWRWQMQQAPQPREDNGRGSSTSRHKDSPGQAHSDSKSAHEGALPPDRRLTSDASQPRIKRVDEDENRRKMAAAAKAALAAEFIRNRQAASETRRRNGRLRTPDCQLGEGFEQGGRTVIDGEQRKAEVRRRGQEERDELAAAQRRELERARLEHLEEMRKARQRMFLQQSGEAAKAATARSDNRACMSRAQECEELEENWAEVEERLGRRGRQAEEEHLLALERARRENEEDRKRLEEKFSKNMRHAGDADEVVEAGSGEDVTTDKEDSAGIVICQVPPRRPPSTAPEEKVEVPEDAHEHAGCGMTREITIPFTDKVRPKPKLSSESRPSRRAPGRDLPDLGGDSHNAGKPAGRGILGPGGRGGSARKGAAASVGVEQGRQPSPEPVKPPGAPPGSTLLRQRPPGQRVQRASGSPAHWLRSQQGTSVIETSHGTQSRTPAAVAAGGATAAFATAAAALAASVDSRCQQVSSPCPPTPQGEGDVTLLQDALANALCSVQGMPALSEGSITEELAQAAFKTGRRQRDPPPQVQTVAEDSAITNWNNTLEWVDNLKANGPVGLRDTLSYTTDSC